tara:strand:- start:8558 stop:10114 length:1557 start_codon:yes stop_codon:yes gene_type:complete
MSVEMFKSNNEVNIASEKLLVQATNGNGSFVEKNKIRFDIPSSAKFISLKECYLHFNIELDSPSIYKFNHSVQDVIKSIRIMEKTTGKIVESIQSYNVLASNMYDYTLRSGAKNMRSQTELSRPEPNNDMYDILYSPFAQPYDDSAGAKTDAKKLIKQKVVVKLYSGLFNKEEDTIYPNVLAPLSIEVELEDNKRALQISDLVNEDLVATGSNTIQFEGMSGNGNVSLTLLNGTSNGFDALDDGIKSSPFSVGDVIKVAGSDGANAEVVGAITSITLTSDEIVVGFASHDAGTTFDSGSKVFLDKSTLNAKYTITEPQIEIANVLTPPEWTDSILGLVSDDEFRFNLNAYENVPVNQTSGNNNFVNYINSNSQSITGVLTIPTNSGTADEYTNALIVGQYEPTGLTSYNYFYNSAPNPNLPVPLSKIKHGKAQQQAFHELRKYYDSIGHPLRDLSHFKDNFCVARAMSVYNGALSLRDRDLSVRFVCENSLSNNVMYNNYLYKNLQLVVNRNGVQIVG